MKTMYVCVYNHPTERVERHAYSAQGIVDFQQGFWINHDDQLTFGIDAMIWIPPSQIVSVFKEEI